MRKFFVIILCCILCCGTFLFTACDDHAHSYGEWVITVEVSCEEDGERTKSCDCGDVITEVIPALGHNFVNGICTDCGAFSK